MFLLFLLFFVHCEMSCGALEGYMPVRGQVLSESKSLQNVPMADKQGLVIRVRDLQIPGVKDPYNPSLVRRSAEGYTVAFRYDLPWDKVSFKKVKIGLVDVDNEFNSVTPAVLLDTHSEAAEDPRLFVHDGQLYVSYSHLTVWGPPYQCCIGMSRIDPVTRSVEYTWDFAFKNGPREKNWTPFTYVNSKNIPELYFVYSYNPFVVIRVQKPISGIIEHPYTPDFATKQNIEHWEKKWGKVCGGTAPVLVDGEYLSFFHSRFMENGRYWYVFGAITFDAEPPFALKKVSPYPILFQNIYRTPIEFSRNLMLRAIFPVGCVLEQEGGKAVLHVLCGENDTGIKIVTIDKELLISQMLSVD